MDELVRLVEAMDCEVCGRIDQELQSPNPATYVGSGKLEELSFHAVELEASYIVFLETLSPAQLKNITNAVDVMVLDRTGLILEIFARRARTREAKLQVESANLQYMLPRLVGMRTSLGRQGGTSGSLSNKGQGEKQIELDRRHIEKRIYEVKRELEAIEHNREVQRKARNRSNLPKVAMVGYTNAGKSTLMNRLLELSGKEEEKKVFEKDMLFATLDTSIRRIFCEDKKDFLLSDTVGFVSDLPHSLIKAFRSTLDEVRYADLLLVVVDASDPRFAEQIDITEDTLKELGANTVPKLYVMNKADRIDVIPKNPDSDRIYISAANGNGVDRLLSAIKAKVYSDNKVIECLIPYTQGNIVSFLKENANILELEYLEDGIKIVADCPEWVRGKINIDY